MAIVLLNVVSVLNNYPSKKNPGQFGTLLVMDKEHTKGDLKGKPICAWKEQDFDISRSSKKGWSYDDEADRITEPVIDRFDIMDHEIDRKVMKAAEAGLAVSI